MDKYNAILNKLQHTAPIVTDPEGLTQRIMKEIEQPVIRRRSKIRIIMTGIAASVLSVWMIDEINYRPVVSPTTKTEEINRPPDNADRSYIPAELSSQEKRTIFYSELKSRIPGLHRNGTDTRTVPVDLGLHSVRSMGAGKKGKYHQYQAEI